MFTLFFILLLWANNTHEDCWETNQRNHQITLPPPRILHYLAECMESKFLFEDILDPLLTTRVPDTDNNEAARNYIVNFLTDLGWNVELDTFTQDTVIGEVTFSNVIATKNVNSPRRLVLAAHYDTKRSPEGFIGATDSAVPCAMMLHLAQTMDSILSPVSGDPELSLQLVFFDGEEAFVSWTSTDSLYGSRHLAATWASQDYNYDGNQYCQSGQATQLDRIDYFILLDLIGAANPQIKRYLEFNTSLYDFTVEVESKVQIISGDMSTVFTQVESNWMVQDDQVPFYNEGLTKILHMISSPFPAVWHTLSDNKDAINFETVKYINKILRIIVYSYLNIN